jgi:hypothetical protein
MNTPKCSECKERSAAKKEHDEGYWNLCDVCFHREQNDREDKIKQLKLEQLLKIAYEHCCSLCLERVNDGWNNKYPNYRDCWGCEKKICDTCFHQGDDETDEYYCEECDKDEKTAD